MLDALSGICPDSGDDDAADSEPADPPNGLVERSPERYQDWFDEGPRLIWPKDEKPESGEPQSDGFHHRPLPSYFDDGVVAPPSVNPSRLPDPFVTCNCEEWQVDHHDPEGDAVTTADTCPTPRPLRRGAAREVYRRIVTANDPDLGGEDDTATDTLVTSKLQQACRQFARVRDGDVLVRAEMDDPTTVMLTLRQSPTDDEERVVSPWTLSERLFANVGSVMDAVRYTINKYGFDRYEWVRVVSGTRDWATPHCHLYLYIDDPDDVVNPTMFESAIEKHVNGNPQVDGWTNHGITDGGAVRVENTPPLATDHYGDPETHGLRRHAPSRGAMYLGAQLPHFALNGETEPWMIDRAVAAWISPRNWFQTSRGFPDFEDAQSFKRADDES